jgi:hypothetical protein
MRLEVRALATIMLVAGLRSQGFASIIRNARGGQASARD